MKQRGLLILAAAVLLGVGAVWVLTRNKGAQTTDAGKAVSRKQTTEPQSPPVPIPPPAVVSADPAAKAPMLPGVPAPSGPAAAGPVAVREPAPPSMAQASSAITPLTAAPPRDSSPGTLPSNLPSVDAATAATVQIDQVGRMLRDYRTLAGGNPVGTNADIMKAVMGGNPKGAILGPPEGQLLNEQGELVDRWGTPYFFHQLSRTDMDIRSAGPDKVLWTSDDVVGR